MKSDTNKAINLSQHGIAREKRKAPEDWRLESIVTTVEASNRKRAKKNPQVSPPPDSFAEMLLAHKKPSNGTSYTLLEMVDYLLIQKDSPVFEKSIAKVFESLNDCGKIKRTMVVSLFPFSQEDTNHLRKLAFGHNQGAPDDYKRYKHIVYMAELFYGLCLAPNHNTTQNPGCEWQLQLYTKNGN